MKESLLKDKIKQKKQAFAELKKEALKVLTDFWMIFSYQPVLPSSILTFMIYL